jgi:hypothetical protein
MERIRDRARLRGDHPPAFAWDCVVSDRNVFAMPEYLSFGIGHEVSRFVFCNLVKYPKMEENLLHISELPLHRLPQVLDLLEQVKNFLTEKHIVFHMDAGLIDAVKGRLSSEKTLNEPPASTYYAKGDCRRSRIRACRCHQASQSSGPGFSGRCTMFVPHTGWNGGLHNL